MDHHHIGGGAAAEDEETVVTERLRQKLNQANSAVQSHLSLVQDHVHFTLQVACQKNKRTPSLYIYFIHKHSGCVFFFSPFDLIAESIM